MVKDYLNTMIGKNTENKNYNNMANGIYKITEDFEKALGDYTGAPYVVTIDNMSNALFLALYYEHHVKKTIPNIIIEFWV
jgi:dTDP-4-amino-4,6-dideoxygalactose transaminase